MSMINYYHTHKRGVIMKQTIYFDMDGTIADFYNVPNWLKYLNNYNCTPYQQAKPLLNFSQFAKILKKLQKNYNIGIISWISKSKNYNFHNETIVIKREWLKKHLPSINWDEIHIILYGTNKNLYNKGNDILFDDEKQNREKWTGIAYDVDNIINVLKSLI